MKADKWLIVAMAGTWLAAGAVEPYFYNLGQPQNPVGVVQSIVLAVLLFSWCKAHAAIHEITPPTAAPLLSGIIPPLGIPYYFLRGFGWRKGLLLTLIAVGCLIGFIALYLVSFTVSAHVGT